MKCGMDGFVQLAQEATTTMLAAGALYKEVGASTLNMIGLKDLAKSMKYLFRAFSSGGDWIGYILASGYYLLKDQGQGKTVCDIAGYGFFSVNNINKLLDFGPPLDSESATTGGGDVV